MSYKPKTSAELLAEHLEKGTPKDRIIEILCRRGDRYLDFYNASQKRVKGLEEEVDGLLRGAGKLITVRVDRIVSDSWGRYVWYKNNKYRYEGRGVWKRHKDSRHPHYMSTPREGIFKVNILLEDEDMPEVFTGVCSGTVQGKKVILAEGHMIGYGDTFELRKVKNETK